MTEYRRASQAATAIEKFAKERGKVECRSVYRGMHRARVKAANRFRSTGIGRRIFGGKGGMAGMRVLIKRMRIRKTANGWVGGLEAKGIAALMETGGKTQPHLIRGRFGALANEAAGFFVSGSKGSRPEVKHPGSRIQKNPQLEDAMLGELPSIASDMDAKLQEFANQVIG